MGQPLPPCQATWLCSTFLSVPLFCCGFWGRSFLRPSGHVFLGLPTHTLPSTLKGLTYLILVILILTSHMANQCNMLVLITYLMFSILSLLFNSSLIWTSLTVVLCTHHTMLFCSVNSSLSHHYLVINSTSFMTVKHSTSHTWHVQSTF